MLIGSHYIGEGYIGDSQTVAPAVPEVFVNLDISNPTESGMVHSPGKTGAISAP